VVNHESWGAFNVLVPFQKLSCVAAGLLGRAAMQLPQAPDRTVKVLRIAGDNTTVYRPAEGRISGPEYSRAERAGHRYKAWMPNDYTFIKVAKSR
jgi:hypothetical protein